MFSLILQSDVASSSVIIAGVVLICVYSMIILDLVHRTLAAMLGAFASLSVLSFIHERPAFSEVMTWIDWETCGLLFGMMIMAREFVFHIFLSFPYFFLSHKVGIFSTTGFFEFCAVRMYKLSRGNLWRLVALLCLFTAVLSAFLDNVTTILLVVPVTMQLCHVLDVDPVLPVMALVFFSNIGNCKEELLGPSCSKLLFLSGGTATAIGDPPNILLVSDQRLQLHSGGAINFGQMTLHLLPGALLVGIAVFFVVRRMFVSGLGSSGGASQARLHELNIWRRAAARVVGSTPEERQVRDQLLRHVAELQKQADEQQADGGMRTIDLAELEQKVSVFCL